MFFRQAEVCSSKRLELQSIKFHVKKIASPGYCYNLTLKSCWTYQCVTWKRDRESGNTEVTGCYYCPCWLDRGWRGRCLTIGEGRCPSSSLYFTSYISAGISGFWCLPMTISYLTAHLVVSAAPPWQYFTLWANLVVFGAHLWQYLTFLSNLVVSGDHQWQHLTLLESLHGGMGAHLWCHQWWANLDQTPNDLDTTIFLDLSPSPIPWVLEVCRTRHTFFGAAL